MSDENFTGLRWEPCYEEEVVILFGLILPYLEEKIVIEEFTGDFPDCRAKVDGEVISMEFEVYASNFFAHKHHNSSRLQECKRIICWRNNIPWKTTNRDGHEFLTINGHEVEIVNLKKIVDDLKNKEFLEFIKEGPRPYIRESNREMIFEQLKNKVDEDKYSLIQELLKFVEGRKEFTIDWGGGKRWYTMR
ncbi:MAG: hypothetical protein GKC03_09285, partial [Methanomassiliicoccales archaeon]|nr:hypothetical protein [Methanomassiliicoccales archaeon]